MTLKLKLIFIVLHEEKKRRFKIMKIDYKQLNLVKNKHEIIPAVHKLIMLICAFYVC